MAEQMKLEELSGCKSYVTWLRGKVDFCKDGREISKELCRILFDIDFTWSVAEDEIRARDAMDLRRKYAEEVGVQAEKSERDIDRIWKSVHGKCSVFELIVSLCIHLDAMVNEEEDGSMVPEFYQILIENAGLDVYDDEDFDQNSAKIERSWRKKINEILDRKYSVNGAGGLFPINGVTVINGKETVIRDQREASIWDQMNTWLGENLDEEGHFCHEK